MIPPAWVLEMAPAKVLHGAVREHGLTSSPVPMTQVRMACACAGACSKRNTNPAAQNIFFMMSSLSVIAKLVLGQGRHPFKLLSGCPHLLALPLFIMV